MILNTNIWQATITAAKLAASASPVWLRAIDRAVLEIERSRYWAYTDGILTIISITSNKSYKIDDAHMCESRAGVCKHRAARKLIQRYTERLAAVEPEAVDAVTKSRRETIERENAILIKRQGKALRIGCFEV